MKKATMMIKNINDYKDLKKAEQELNNLQK